jgi:adenylate cyclase
MPAGGGAWHSPRLRRRLALPLAAPLSPLPRIAVHYGVALFRDGDYYGRDINIASRVTARAAGGEVLVTRPVVEVAGGGGHLEFERSGEVTLKGFSESTEVFVARQRREESE